MPSTMPQPGLIGFLFDASKEHVPAAECATICEMAAEIRKRIIIAIAKLDFCPGNAIEIDGEKWAPDRVLDALRRLYDWTYRACEKETEPTAAAFISRSTPC